MRLTVITFNIWDLPLWFVRGRAERIRRVAEHLKKTAADIICLQESFDVKHRHMIADILGPAYHMSDGHEETRRILGLKTFDMTGGLVIFSRFPIVKSRFTPFNRLLNVSYLEFLARKGFLEITVETPKGPLHIVDTHLHLISLFGGRAVRVRQVQKVLTSLSAVREPVIFAGDFNEDRITETPAFAALFREFGFFHPEMEGKEPFSPSYRKENPLVNLWPNRIKMSERDDYIFLRSVVEAGWRVAHYAPYTKGERLSDHDPVVLTLEKD